MLAPELRPWIASTGQDGNRYSMQEFAGDGVRTSFELNFAGGYIDPANVRAYTYVAATGEQTPVTVVLTGPNTISVVPAVPVGSFLVVYRDTDKSQPLVDFADGAVMSEANLDLVARQAIFATAEMVDRFYVTEQTVTELSEQAQEATERSEQALEVAGQANEAAASAVTTAGQALAGVTGATEAAVAATAAALAATTAAENADQAVEDVRGLAQSAEDKATAAVDTANGIDGKAQAALDNSTAAVAAADAATNTANGVDGKAQAALDASETAQTDAADAKELAGQNALPVSSVSWWHYRPSIWAGAIPGDGQIVNRATYPDLTQMVIAGLVPVVPDADWLADPLKRGCYTLGDGSTTIRVPDYNGKYAGSLGALVLRGDGAMSAAVAGRIQRDALQNITGHFTGRFGAIYPGGFAGALKVEAVSTSDAAIQLVSTGPQYRADFDASRVARTDAETRMLNVTGCFVIKAFGAVVNPGSVNAAQLASDYAVLNAAVQSLDGRLTTVEGQIFGRGQSRQDVSASRATGTIYTNSTSKPILVSVRGIGSGSTISMALQVDDVVMERPGWPGSFSGGTVAGSMIVPSGSTYRVFTDGIVSIVWMEYR